MENLPKKLINIRKIKLIRTLYVYYQIITYALYLSISFELFTKIIYGF